MGILCYFGILVIVPYLNIKPENRTPYDTFHLRQGLGLTLTSVVWSIATGILAYVPFGSKIGGLGFLVLFVLAIIGILGAAKKQLKKVPLLGDIFQDNLTFIK